MRLVCHQRALFLLRFREAAAIVLHPRTAYYIPQNPRTDHPKIPCTTTRAREANPHPHPHSQKYQNFECTACHVTCTHKTYMLLTTPTCTHKMPHVLTKVYIYSQNLHVLTKPTCTHKSVHLLTKCHMYSQNLHVTHKMPHVLTTPTCTHNTHKNSTMSHNIPPCHLRPQGVSPTRSISRPTASKGYRPIVPA